MDQETLTVATLASAVGTTIMVTLASRAFLASRAARRAAELGEGGSGGPETLQEQLPPDKGQKDRGAFARMMRPKTVDELSVLRRRLARAGLRANEAVDLFSIARAVSLIAGTAVGCLVLIATSFGAAGFFIGAVLMGLGLYGPSMWLNMRTSRRQEALTNSLPPTLDLLVTCMEAGLGLEQALGRVGSETGFSDPEMADELSIVVAEMRAGLSIGEAFRKFADRVTSEDVQTLSNVIIQSTSLGASLGRTLREYASSARRRRELVLEEAAGKVTAGLTLPLTLCLLPSAVIAMLGPAVVIVVRTMFE